jgi:AraC-like DNA-binding protein
MAAHKQMTTSSAELMTCFELDTDRSPESLSISRARNLPGVEFWTISASQRPRTFVSDMFTACLVQTEEAVAAGTCWSRGDTRPLHSGAVLLAEPGEAQVLTTAESPASFFIVGIRASVMDRVATEMGITGALRWRSAQLEPGPCTEALVRVAECVRAPASGAAVEHALSEATTELVLAAGEPAAGRRFGSVGHPGVRRALERLVDGVREPTSLDELAKEARLSKYHFVRCFRHSVGFAPYRYRKLLRVIEARRLLESGLSVAEAAEQACFADASHLSRTFRDWVGVTPGLWANAWRASEPYVESASRTRPPPSSDPLVERKVG